MAENNRPRGREKNVSGTGKDVVKRGTGLGTGPVGTGKGQGKPEEEEKTGLAGLLGSLFGKK